MVYRIKVDKEKNKWIGKGYDQYMYSGKYRVCTFVSALSFNTYDDAMDAVKWCKQHNKISDYYEIIVI